MVAQSARDGLTDVRWSIKALRPDALERSSLAEALEGLVENFHLTTSAEIEYSQEAGLLEFATDEDDFDLLVSSGALAKLDGHMAVDQDFDTALYYEPCLRSGQVNGSQYALPHESVPTIMFVNKTLLEENGISCRTTIGPGMIFMTSAPRLPTWTAASSACTTTPG